MKSAWRGQRGGFGVGLVTGLLIGLALALAVALFVTKAPIPFVNKVPQRTAAQDAAEAEKNKNWDPNSPLYGKNPARPLSSASGVVAAPEGTAPPLVTAPPSLPPPPPTLPPPVAVPSLPPAALPRASAPGSSRDPAAILADRPATRTPAAPAVPPAPSALGSDPFTYFVQVGAYAHPEDADQQRARLAIIGLEGRVTERDQSGRTVYRVRVGPFEQKTDADTTKEKLLAAGVEAQLVRVQR